MFEFSTNTVINSIDAPKFKSGVRFKADGETFKIARHAEFKKDQVKKIYVRPYQESKKFKITIKAGAFNEIIQHVNADGGKSFGRLHLYIRLSDNNNPLYANDLVFKGRPFDIEFVVKEGDTAEKIVPRIINNAQKYENVVLESPVVELKAGATAGDLVIEALDEFQKITEVSLEWYNSEHSSFDCCSYFGGFEGVADDNIEVEQGKPGFGNYRQLIKNARIPTLESRRWAAPAPDEQPMLGGHYDEYIIYQCVRRDGLYGGDAVGEVITSQTYHVYYVLNTGEVGDNGYIAAAAGPSAEFRKNLESVFGKALIEDADEDKNYRANTKDEIEESFNSAEKVTEAQNAAHGK